MQDDNNRNTIIFVICAALLLFGYQALVLEPQAKRRQIEAAAQRPAATASAVPGAAALAPAPRELPLAEALAQSPRVKIATPALAGTLSLKGARIDDLSLTQYRQTLDKDSPPVELLRPHGAKHAWFADFGWSAANIPVMPTTDTVWTLAEGSTLSPGKPVTLIYDNGVGLRFTRRVEVDDRYMFTVTDTVANLGAGPVTMAPYALVQRQGIDPLLGKNQIVHEGGIGWLDNDLRQLKYPKWAKQGPQSFSSTGGWSGITDKYWLAAIIPDQHEKVEGRYRYAKVEGVDVFEANLAGAPKTIPAGRQITETTRLFAGAKTVPVLRDYQASLKVSNFDNAVDWGMFRIITRPLFQFLDFVYRQVGNFGLAIMILTVTVRLLFFPLANKQYESVTKMKKLQPAVEELKARFKDDVQKQQQEMMELYKREKINPLAGCFPIMIQIPVFFALYKVLTVTIEMRHAPFFGWIRDLSARDPTTIMNLFGLIPWNPATAPLIGGFLDGPLHLGVWPLAYAVTMWLTMSMSPPAGDPVQQQIFKWMPVIFTFVVTPLAAGLIIYWTWSNVLTILQQYVIMRRFKVDNPIDQIIGKLRGKSSNALIE